MSDAEMEAVKGKQGGEILAYKLDQLTKLVREQSATLVKISDENIRMQMWRASAEDRFTHIDERVLAKYIQLHDHIVTVDQRTTEASLDGKYIRKEAVRLIAAGFMLAGILGVGVGAGAAKIVAHVFGG